MSDLKESHSRKRKIIFSDDNTSKRLRMDYSQSESREYRRYNREQYSDHNRRDDSFYSETEWQTYNYSKHPRHSRQHQHYNNPRDQHQSVRDRLHYNYYPRKQDSHRKRRDDSSSYSETEWQTDNYPRYSRDHQHYNNPRDHHQSVRDRLHYNYYPRKHQQSSRDYQQYEEFEFFWKSHSPYSQWFKCKFTVDGETFNCAEQFMMYSKAMLFGDKKIAKKVLQTHDPKEHKQLGRQVKNFDQETWDESCMQIVKDGNKAKFSQSEYLLKTILKTYPRTLVEASPFDKIWGIGLEAKDPRALDRRYWNGQNLLGQALTEVRDELRRSEKERQTSVHNDEDQ